MNMELNIDTVVALRTNMKEMYPFVVPLLDFPFGTHRGFVPTCWAYLVVITEVALDEFDR